MKKKAITQIAFEFLSIVFAVLLALGLNTYKQSIDAQNESATIKKSILKECKENAIKIDSMLLGNQAYFKYLDSLVSLEPADVNSVSFYYDLDLLTNAAWTIAQNNSAVNNLDQEFLVAVAEIYQAQEFFSEFSRSFFENIGTFITKQDETDPYNTALSLYFNVSTMNGTAKSLQVSYDSLFSTYGENKK